MSDWTPPRTTKEWREVALRFAYYLRHEPCLAEFARADEVPCLPCRAVAVSRTWWRQHIDRLRRIGSNVPRFAEEQAHQPAPCIDESEDSG